MKIFARLIIHLAKMAFCWLPPVYFMSIMGVSIDWQQAIKGFVLLIAVGFDVISKMKSKV